MTEAKRKAVDEDRKKSGDPPENDTPKTRGGSADKSKGLPVRADPPSYDDPSMPIDPPDNTGGGGW